MAKHKHADLPGQQEIKPDGSIGPAEPTNSAATVSEARKRFVKHAGRRTGVLLKKLQQFGNMSSRNSYEMTDQERDEMLALVDDAYKAMRARFLPVPGASAAARPLFSWEKPNGTGGGGHTR